MMPGGCDSIPSDGVQRTRRNREIRQEEERAQIVLLALLDTGHGPESKLRVYLVSGR